MYQVFPGNGFIIGCPSGERQFVRIIFGFVFGISPRVLLPFTFQSQKTAICFIIEDNRTGCGIPVIMGSVSDVPVVVARYMGFPIQSVYRKSKLNSMHEVVILTPIEFSFRCNNDFSFWVRIHHCSPTDNFYFVGVFAELPKHVIFFGRL